MKTFEKIQGGSRWSAS